MTIPLTLRRTSAHTNRRPRPAAGFTLTEILIAIALIAIIVGVAVANLNKFLDQGKTTAAHIFVTDGVKTPLMQYKLNTGHYPTTDQGLQALITPPENEPGWHGPYFDDTVKAVPNDPWGHEYRYVFPGTHNPSSYDCWSAGESGQDGNEDNIGNW